MKTKPRKEGRTTHIRTPEMRMKEFTFRAVWCRDGNLRESKAAKWDDFTRLQPVRAIIEKAQLLSPWIVILRETG